VTRFLTPVAFIRTDYRTQKQTTAQFSIYKNLGRILPRETVKNGYNPRPPPGKPKKKHLETYPANKLLSGLSLHEQITIIESPCRVTLSHSMVRCNE
jgi:hypothetical protein